ncbi:MAG: type II toxin-antitoxin system HicA family toxin [Candidatus Aminicenantes bacterium]|nr:type II toxin-antitoxin system HicA family toxin [Candidatus Aminicenantes bacterium]
MKRKELIKHLEKCGCLLLREGANHSVYVNKNRKKVSTVPRHIEINDLLARKICKDLEIELL